MSCFCCIVGTFEMFPWKINQKLYKNCLFRSFSYRMWVVAEHSQKLTPYLLQNNIALYSKLYWKRKSVADINFWCFIKLQDWAFQWKKKWNFLADQIKSYAFNKWTRDCSWRWHVADIPLSFVIGIRLSKID